ncbi:transposase [Streptomyces sp. NPDC002778]
MIISWVGNCGSGFVPDDLWGLVEPVLPSSRSRPQDGGTVPIDQRAVFTAVVYVLASGCAGRCLPPTFGVSPATAHRRCSVCTASGGWRCLHRVILDEIGARGARAGLRRCALLARRGCVRADAGVDDFRGASMQRCWWRR